MSKNKTEINAIRAERFKKIIEEEGLSQKEFGRLIYMSQQNVSRIINMHVPLTEESAKRIVSVFPKYKLQWLLGYEDSMTLAEQLSKVVKETKEEAMLLDNGFFSFAKLSGFQIDVASMPDKCSVKKLFQNMKEYCTIGRDGKSITMSMEELNAFENELCDYVEFRLLHMIK